MNNLDLYVIASRTGIPQGTLEIVTEKINCRCGDLIKQYDVHLSRIFSDIL